jgi:hypothetical protein
VNQEVIMTFGNATALGLGLVGALALGVAIGPQVRELGGATTAAPTAHVAAPASAPSARAAATAEKTARKAAAAISAADVEVHAHVKPLLNKGADMTLASEGFDDAEQFVTVAHAARNTEIPFVLLKHRVLTEGKSLTAAIRESKPEVDAAIEANRARAEAKSDIARLSRG